jgi:hypothetical protein
MAVNMMIGGFKPNFNKNIKWLSVCITANSCEAYNHFLQNKGCFIEVITINEVKFLNFFMFNQLILKLKNQFMIKL